MRDYKKNIANKDAKHSRTAFLNKDAVEDCTNTKRLSESALKEQNEAVEDKGMTSRDFTAFGTGSSHDLIKDTFSDKPLLVKALKEAGLTYSNQIPKNINKLVEIKGIGEWSANFILERLS